MLILINMFMVYNAYVPFNVFFRDTTKSLAVVMGALYSSAMFLGVNNSSSVQPIVSIERTVFYRERAAGMYSPFPYAFAQVSISTPTFVYFGKINSSRI